MSDERIRELGREVIAEAINRVELPPNTVKNEINGFWELAVDINLPSGGVTIHYKPQLAVEQIIRKLDKAFEEDWKNTEWDSDEEFRAIYHSTVEEPSAYAAEVLLTQFYYEFEDAVKLLPESALIQTECVGKEWHKQLSNPEDVQETESSENAVDKYLRSVNKGRRNRMMKLIKEAREEARYDMSKFAVHYHQMLPVWQEVKKFYNKNKKLKTWQATIKTAFPEPTLPDDLIERLASPDSYASSPSEIALEHAARLCGVPPNKYKSRSLYGFLSKSQKAQGAGTAKEPTSGVQ